MISNKLEKHESCEKNDKVKYFHWFHAFFSDNETFTDKIPRVKDIYILKVG